MEFRILGPVGVSDAGGEIALGGRRHRALLATLLMHAGAPVSADRLVEALWGTREPASARQMLHVIVSELRRALFAGTSAAGEIVARRPGYELRVDRRAVDAHRFEQLAASGRRALEGGDPAGAAEELRAALGLWRGRPLAELAERAFAQSEIARLEGIKLQVHEALLDAELAAGRHRDVLGELEQLVVEHPLREGLRARLMLALYRSARQGDALAAYQEGADYLRDELGLDPGVELRELRDAILRQEQSLLPPGTAPRVDPPAAAPRPGPPAHNLPVQFTSFVGRDAEIAEVEAMLATSRLVTLTGVGGAGKSRLAMEVAAGQLGVRPDGVWLVELGAVLEPELVDSTVAKVLRVPEHPRNPPREQVVERIRHADLLLIIDNCEHLVAPVARLVRDVLRACPGVRMLCTSRERLGITGEVVRTVNGLSLPDPDELDLVRHGDAVRLFTERAASVRAGQLLDGPATVAVVEICRRLDGLPLAIELAAARTTVLAPRQIERRLDGRFHLLTGGSRDALPQHQTLRAVVDWSYELLDAEEQRFFDHLAVFVGGFTLEAAEQVCLDPTDADRGAELLARLVDKSLVVADTFDLPEYRYRLLESLREYGAERLAERDGSTAVRDRHAGYFRSLAQLAATGLRTGEQRDWLHRIAAEHGNVRAALDHSISTGDQLTAATLAGSLYQFWDLHGHYAEGRRWLELVRDHDVAAPLRARVLMGTATLAVIQGDMDQAVAACEQARTVSEGSGDAPGLAHALQYLGLIAIYTGDLDRAREMIGAALATAIVSGARWEHGWALFFDGLIALAESDFVETEWLCVRAEQVIGPDGDRELLSWLICVRGAAQWGWGGDQAAALLAAGLRSFRDLGGVWGTSIALTFCGLLLADRPLAAEAAVSCIAAGERMRESVGIDMIWFVVSWLGETKQRLNERLGADAFHREWRNGRHLTTDAAVDLAIAELLSPGRPEHAEPAAEIHRRR